MNAEEITKVIDKLTEVGEKLAQAGQPYLLKSWSMLVKLTYIEAWRSFGIGLALILLSILAFILAAREDDMDAKKEGVEGSVRLYFVVREDGTVKETIVVEKADLHRVIICVSLVVCVVGLALIGHSIPGLFAPDAVTLKSLLKG